MSLIYKVLVTRNDLERAYDSCQQVATALLTAIPKDVDGELRSPVTSGVPFISSGFFYIILKDKRDTRRVVHALELIGFSGFDKDALSNGELYITMTRHFGKDYFAIVCIQNISLAGCTVEEEYVTVPERIERRFKIVCDNGATEL